MADVVFRYPPLQNALQKSLSAQLDVGVTASMTLNNTTNIPNKPGICVVDRIDNTGALKSTAVREYIAYTGTSGSTLTGLTRNVDNSSSDQGHAVGAIVEFISDVTWAQAIMDALDGTKSGVKLLTPKIDTSINDTNGNEVIKTPATASAVNEITAANAATGNAPTISATGNDTNINLKLVAKGTGVLVADSPLNYAADAGTTDAYTITITGLSAYAVGLHVRFKANTANTGAATLNVNSLGAITIKKNHDQDLADNDIEVGQIVDVVYDGTNFQMQSQTAALSTIQSVQQSTTLANSSTTSTTDVDMVTITFTPPTTANILVSITGVWYNGSTYSNYGGVYLDGVLQGSDFAIQTDFTTGSKAASFATQRWITGLSSASHTVAIKFRTSNAAGAANINYAILTILVFNA